MHLAEAQMCVTAVCHTYEIYTYRLTYVVCTYIHVQCVSQLCGQPVSRGNHIAFISIINYLNEIYLRKEDQLNGKIYEVLW